MFGSRKTINIPKHLYAKCSKTEIAFYVNQKRQTMIKIRGVENNEVEDLDFNLDKIRNELRHKAGFWFLFNEAVTSYERENNIGKAGGIYKMILFFTLLPNFINMLFYSKTNSIIKQAEIELVRHYDRPKTKVKRFRLKCTFEKELNQRELELIEKELLENHKILELESIGSQTKNKIRELIEAYESKKLKRLKKYYFYSACEKKLIKIEEQIHIRNSIENSRMKLEKMNERKVEEERHDEIEKEFELYKYYGTLLDSISINFEKLELDEDERMEELELREMIRQIDFRN